mgnify:CR=1 FL=1
MPKQNQYIFHDFYCINCGNKSYTLPRKTSKLKEQFHRKVLFCPCCKKDINHVECRNEEEVKEFKEAYDNGEYIAEAEAPVVARRDTWLWERHILK